MKCSISPSHRCCHTAFAVYFCLCSGLSCGHANIKLYVSVQHAAIKRNQLQLFILGQFGRVFLSIFSYREGYSKKSCVTAPIGHFWPALCSSLLSTQHTMLSTGNVRLSALGIAGRCELPSRSPRPTTPVQRKCDRDATRNNTGRYDIIVPRCVRVIRSTATLHLQSTRSTWYTRTVLFVVALTSISPSWPDTDVVMFVPDVLDAVDIDIRCWCFPF